MNPYQGQYRRDVDQNSAMTKMEHTFWITKQNVLKKIGKKEDECIVASDAELDAKLELFRSIQDSCFDLHKIVDRYEERLCCLAQEENALGRFLKDAGAADDTQAGKMLNNVGRALSYSGKQRLIVRPALLRLCQEVETFRLRAIADTLANLRAMEKQRVEYRAALRWMKDVSQELDPERQLDKFRKVQAQVRRSKQRFDQLKLDCLQKIDLLAAARCNMFSHALVLYHKNLLEFCEKATFAFNAVAKTCKGYHHYEFSVVKELMEPSLRLAEQLNGEASSEKPEDKDILLFFDSEYRDEEFQKEPEKAAPAISDTVTDDDALLDLSTLDVNETPKAPSSDLDGLFQQEVEGAGWSQEWNEMFGDSPVKTKLAESSASGFCPSLLLEQSPLWPKAEAQNTIPMNLKPKPASNPWLNLFADLDPLADPDAVGARAIIDRNC